MGSKYRASKTISFVLFIMTFAGFRLPSSPKTQPSILSSRKPKKNPCDHDERTLGVPRRTSMAIHLHVSVLRARCVEFLRKAHHGAMQMQMHGRRLFSSGFLFSIFFLHSFFSNGHGPSIGKGYCMRFAWEVGRKDKSLYTVLSRDQAPPTFKNSPNRRIVPEKQKSLLPATSSRDLVGRT